MQGSQGSDQLDDIAIPAHHINVLESMPTGEPFNVGQMYYKFGEAIRGSSKSEPNFEIAVELHRFLDNIRESNKTGARVVVGG